MEALFLPMEQMIEALTTFLATAEGSRRIIVILGVAFAAIFEELAFRGALQPLLFAPQAAHSGALPSHPSSSAPSTSSSTASRRGSCCARSAGHRSGSLVPGMVAHFVNNSLAAATLWVTGSMADDLLDLSPLLIGGSLVLTAGAVWAYDRVIPRSTPA